MSEWGDTTLEDLLVLYDSGTWGQPAIQQQGLPVLRSTNIQGWELTLKTDLAYRTVSERDMERRKLEKGDLIVTKSSGSSHLIGEAALFNLDDSQGHYLFSNFTLRLRPNQALILPKYLHYYLRSPKARQVIADMHRTTSGLRNLQMTEYLSQPVVMPFQDEPERSLAEQQRIVARIEALLAEVREMRELHEEITADADAFMNAVLREMFRELQKNHQLESLGNENLCEIIPGQHILSRDYTDSPPGIPYITGPADFEEKYPNISRWTTKPKVLSKPGDVLFTVKGSGVGKVNCVPDSEEVAIGRQIMAIRTNPEFLLPDYLFYNLYGRFNEFQQLRQGAAIPGIRKDHVEAIELPIPSVTVQKQVVSHLETVRLEITEMQKSQSEDGQLLDELEQAILSQAFRGEL